MKFSVQGDALADSWNVYSDIYQGDALTQLKGIKAETGTTGDWVKVDHNSLPVGILKNNPISNYENFYEPIKKEVLIELGGLATTTTTEYKKISDGTIISEEKYNALTEAEKGKTNTWTLPTMSISGLTTMNTQAIIQLDARVSALEKPIGSLTPQGDFKLYEVNQALAELQDKIDKQQKEIEDLKKQISDITLGNLILKIFK